MASKPKNAYGLTISPQKAEEAIAVLAQYVLERAKMVEDGKLKTVQEAVRMQGSIDRFKDEVADRVKSPAEALYNRLRFTTVPNLMDDEGIETIGVEGVGRVHLEDDISVKVESKEGLNEWLTANGLEDLIKETVNAQTLAASMRQRIKDNAKRVKEMQGTDIDPSALLPMPPAEVCSIKPLVRAVIKA